MARCCGRDRTGRWLVLCAACKSFMVDVWSTLSCDGPHLAGCMGEPHTSVCRPVPCRSKIFSSLLAGVFAGVVGITG